MRVALGFWGLVRWTPAAAGKLNSSILTLACWAGDPGLWEAEKVGVGIADAETRKPRSKMKKAEAWM